MSSSIVLKNVHWHKKSKTIGFDFGAESFELTLEYLRVFSPSAEVQGHGPGQEKLVSGKRFVDLANLEPMGNYALKLTFDDGHDSGLYTWDYLYQLGKNYQQNWQQYLQKLTLANKNREGNDVHIIKLT